MLIAIPAYTVIGLCRRISPTSKWSTPHQKHQGIGGMPRKRPPLKTTNINGVMAPDDGGSSPQ